MEAVDKNIKIKKNNLAKVDSKDLMYYLISKYNSLEHLKIQKLIYYIEAYHLAYFEKSIIDDDFQAWLHGPVSRKVYNAIKPINANVYDNIILKWDKEKKSKFIKEFEAKLTPSQLELLNDILNEFGKKSGYELECLTHEETPYIEARKGYGAGDKCEVVISKKTMLEYYQNKLYGEVHKATKI